MDNNDTLFILITVDESELDGDITHVRLPIMKTSMINLGKFLPRNHNNIKEIVDKCTTF